MEILHLYKGEEPFSAFLKKYFSAHSKYGARDRKQVGHLCYCFFRLGNACASLPVHERIGVGLFLCSGAPDDVLQHFRPDWNEAVRESTSMKITLLDHSFSIDDLFPITHALSGIIHKEKFCLSFLIQPDLFLRMRPGNETIAIKKLADAGIRYCRISDQCIALPNATKISPFIEADKEVVIQDASSQRVLSALIDACINDKCTDIWDCCAASGGKSILAYDSLDNIRLTVSDIRTSIIANLRKRFSRAGIKKYDWFIADVSSSSFSIAKQFDVVICDAPCSGSGTWARTPEQLVYFDKGKIDSYSDLQKKIAANAAKQVKKGGHFLYITCSVFEKENEEVAAFIETNTALKLQSCQYLTGYEKRADTLFAALFSR